MKVYSIISLLIYLFFMAAVVPDDTDFFQDGPSLPQDKPISPGPDLDQTRNPILSPSPQLQRLPAAEL